MRIVLITKEDKNTTSPRLNEYFLQRIGEFKDVKLMTVMAYNHKKQKINISAKKVLRRYRPDVVICHAHSNVLDGYFKPFKDQLKIMIAVDFWKIIQQNKLDWYHNNNFDLTIHRHILSNIKNVNTETVWLPFSANHLEFYPQKLKLPYIGFAGSCMSPVYEERRRSIHYLDEHGLIVYNRRNRGVIRYKNNYSKFLRTFKGNLCSSELDSPYGKLFEIMASGSIPLIPKFNGKEQLFKNDTMVHYKKDCSDIQEQASTILNDDDFRKELTINAYNNYINHHTDDHRINELYNIIKAKYQGNKVPKIWENE